MGFYVKIVKTQSESRVTLPAVVQKGKGKKNGFI